MAIIMDTLIMTKKNTEKRSPSENPIRREIGTRMKISRLATAMSLRDVESGANYNLKRSALHNYESGLTSVPADILHHLATEYKTPIESFFPSRLKYESAYIDKINLLISYRSFRRLVDDLCDMPSDKQREAVKILQSLLELKDG